MKELRRATQRELADDLLKQNSRTYKAANGLIFFRTNKVVGLGAIGAGISGILAAGSLPYDYLVTTACVFASLIFTAYGGYHIDRSSVDD
jgi:hypothetical protein